MSTTSGRSSRADASAREPLSASRDDLDIVLCIQQSDEPGPHQGLIVGDQHSNSHVCQCCFHLSAGGSPKR